MPKILKYRFSLGCWVNVMGGPRMGSVGQIVERSGEEKMWIVDINRRRHPIHESHLEVRPRPFKHIMNDEEATLMVGSIRDLFERWYWRDLDPEREIEPISHDTRERIAGELVRRGVLDMEGYRTITGRRSRG